MRPPDILLWISDPNGYYLAPVTRFESLTYNLGGNGVGGLQATFTPKFDRTLLALDAPVEVWMKPHGGCWFLDGSFLLKSWPQGVSAQGRPTLSITCKSIDSILETRINEEVGENESRTILFSDFPPSGYFTLRYGGQTTGHIAAVDSSHMPDPGGVEAALAALSSIKTGNVAVALVSKTYTVTFQNDLGERNLTGDITAPDNTTTKTITISPNTGGATVDGASPINKGDAVDSTPVPAVPADDLMKWYVRKALGSLAAASRDRTPYGFAIQADLGQGRAITTQHENETLLATLQAVAQQNLKEGGRAQLFDVTQTGFQPAVYEFRTYSDQRGDNRTLTDGRNPIVLSAQMGNMGEATLTYDFSDFASAARVGGMGNGAARPHQEVYDTTLTVRSKWAGHEVFVDAGDTTDTAVMTARGNEELFNNRPRWTFTGRLVQNKWLVYGRDIRRGDKVTVQLAGEVFDARMDGTNVQVDGNGVVTVDALWAYSKVGFADA